MTEIEAAGALRSLRRQLSEMVQVASEAERAFASAQKPLKPELELARKLHAALREANSKVPEPPPLKPS